MDQKLDVFLTLVLPQNMGWADETHPNKKWAQCAHLPLRQTRREIRSFVYRQDGHELSLMNLGTLYRKADGRSRGRWIHSCENKKGT